MTSYFLFLVCAYADIDGYSQIYVLFCKIGKLFTYFSNFSCVYLQHLKRLTMSSKSLTVNKSSKHLCFIDNRYVKNKQSSKKFEKTFDFIVYLFMPNFAHHLLFHVPRVPVPSLVMSPNNCWHWCIVEWISVKFC